MISPLPTHIDITFEIFITTDKTQHSPFNSMFFCAHLLSFNDDG